MSTPAVRTADLSDASGDRLLPCSLPWRSVGGLTSFAGPVATVRCPDDDGLLRSLLAAPGRGRVLVVDGLGSLALGTDPRRGGREGTGEADVPVSFDGVTFHPGCTVHADEDDLLVDTRTGQTGVLP